MVWLVRPQGLWCCWILFWHSRPKQDHVSMNFTLVSPWDWYFLLSRLWYSWPNYFETLLVTSLLQNSISAKLQSDSHTAGNIPIALSNSFWVVMIHKCLHANRQNYDGEHARTNKSNHCCTESLKELPMRLIGFHKSSNEHVKFSLNLNIYTRKQKQSDTWNPALNTTKQIFCWY